MTDPDRKPTLEQIIAAQGIVIVRERLGRPIPDRIRRDAEWPIEDAAPYRPLKTG